MPNEKMRISLPFGDIYPSEIVKVKAGTELVFLNACSTHYKKMAMAFTPSSCFLAPFYAVDWDKAMMFAVRFYQRFLVMRNSISSARYRAARELGLTTTYPHVWTP